MIKSGFTLLLILIFLLIASKYGIFEILTSQYTLWIGLGLSICMLVVAFLIIGSPFRKNK